MKRTKVRIDDLRALLKILENNEKRADCASFVFLEENHGQVVWYQPSNYGECFGQTCVLKTEKYE